MSQPHHLIFEGAELAGKSWLISQVYNFLEPKYNTTNNKILDGCLWFNSDIGIFGTPLGKEVIKKYIEMGEILKKKNLIFEKFFVSDIVYNLLYWQRKIDYYQEIDFLKKMKFKIVFVRFPEEEKILQQRIQDRLNLYPHYSHILKPIAWYFRQQKLYEKIIKESGLPFLTIDTFYLPDQKLVKKILKWIKEIK